jgi:hypothetical protein
MQISPSNEEIVEEFTKTVRKAVRLTINQHADPAVEVPAKDHDLMTRLNRGRTEGAKIRLSVDQERCSVSAFHLPAIASDFEK